ARGAGGVPGGASRPLRAQPRRRAGAHQERQPWHFLPGHQRLCERSDARLEYDEEDAMVSDKRAEKRIGIIMHGVTGRMGMNQHLIRSILEIRRQGGVALRDGTRLMPDPLLVGRNAPKVEALAREHGVERWTSDLDSALSAKEDQVFFDAASTQLRPKLIKRAIAAGKHIYCEKPVSTTLAEAKGLYA